MDFNFELILTLAVVITGIIFVLDKLFGSKQKRVTFIKKQKIIFAVMDYSRSLFPVLFLVFILRSFVVEPFRVPSGSMYPTIQIGDFILVNKFSYGIRLPVTGTKVIDLKNPKFGDVIVFKAPENESIDYIKRVVGTPGDTVSYQDRILFINGKEIARIDGGFFEGLDSGVRFSGFQEYTESNQGVSYKILHDVNSPIYRMNLSPTVIPEGYYFVMGDNREHSEDSRFWGFLPEKNIKGKAMFVWMNWDKGIRFDRIGADL